MLVALVLPRTFMFLPGIGPVREGRLWKRGVATWKDYRALSRVQGVRPKLKERHDEVLSIAESCLGRDPAFFARLLPSSEHWRAFGAFGHRAAYVDIETTGDRENLVTVVGVRYGGESRAFVRGIDYTPEAVSGFLSGATSLVTFNGASFDLPVLQNEGVKLPQVPHMDLRLVLARIGYTGGLKKIEETLAPVLGTVRDERLQGLSGWDAVKLWRRWEREGDRGALDTLVAYNVADFENLEPLADFAYSRLAEQTLAPLTAQARLPESGREAPPAGP